MKKLIALLLVLTLALPMIFAASAESPEIQGKELDQMLPMYFWMLGKIWDDVPYWDTSISILHEKDNAMIFSSGAMGGRTFSNSEIIERAGIMLFNSDHFKDQLNAFTPALIFAMEYTFKDTLWMKQPFDTISEELAPIVNTVLAGEPYVSEPYVYHLKLEESEGVSSIAVWADHIDLYRAEHPEFTE